MTVLDTPDTVTRTLVMDIPDLTVDAFFGGGCCVVLAEDAVRRELQSWPGVIDVDIDPANGQAIARAIRCASTIVEGGRDLGLEIRAGLHTRECELVDNDVRGITVHIEARVAADARPGEVLVSKTVKDLVAGSGIEFDDWGPHFAQGCAERLAALLSQNLNRLEPHFAYLSPISRYGR